MGVWTARQIWNGLDRDRREEIARAFWHDERLGASERRAALDPWLRARGMRPAYLDKRSKQQRAALMAQGGLPEETALQVLMSYHLSERSEMLSQFLDELGIEHADGLIESEPDADGLDQETLEKAVASLREAYDDADVELYLQTLTASDATSWAALAPLVPDP